jgi:cytoskeleton protein RodZ
MSDGVADGQLFPERVGDRLRAARLAAGLDLSDIASKTRVPLRHLTSIENGDYAALPSSTYAVGFVKSFARVVGADEKELATALKIEMGQQPPETRYEPSFIEEGIRGPVPSRTLAITAALIGIALISAYFIWFSPWSANRAPGTVAETSAEPEQRQVPVAQAPTLAAPVSAANEVVLTATENVWLRIYDANDKVLLEKEMPAGERYIVPADANNPMIRTGKADRIAVTIDGKQVAPLGPAERTVKDVGISAAALAARAGGTSSNNGNSATAAASNP